MPLGAQPRRARGTVGQPYSALNIRMVLAAIGLIAYAALAGLAFALNHPVFGTILAVLAATALWFSPVRRYRELPAASESA